jgi:gluconolactonase
VIPPTSLGEFRGGGQFCFNWYRITLTIPDTVANTPVAGRQAVLSVAIDDMAEVWVNGKLPASMREANPNLVTGWNTKNRVALGTVKPGDTFQIAIFGINGPISAVPTNRIFVKEARVEFLP